MPLANVAALDVPAGCLATSGPVEVASISSQVASDDLAAWGLEGSPQPPYQVRVRLGEQPSDDTPLSVDLAVPAALLGRSRAASLVGLATFLQGGGASSQVVSALPGTTKDQGQTLSVPVPAYAFSRTSEGNGFEALLSMARGSVPDPPPSSAQAGVSIGSPLRIPLHIAPTINSADGGRWGLTRSNHTQWHNGVDLSTQPGGPGSNFVYSVYAAHDGRAEVRNRPDNRDPKSLGLYVIIRSPTGGNFFTVYAHLSRTYITTGNVTKGELIGESGKTGAAYNDSKVPNKHLHFEYGIGTERRVAGGCAAGEHGNSINPWPLIERLAFIRDAVGHTASVTLSPGDTMQLWAIDHNGNTMNRNAAGKAYDNNDLEWSVGIADADKVRVDSTGLVTAVDPTQDAFVDVTVTQRSMYEPASRRPAPAGVRYGVRVH